MCARATTHGAQRPRARNRARCSTAPSAPRLPFLPTSSTLPPLLIAVIISGVVRRHSHRLPLLPFLRFCHQSSPPSPPFPSFPSPAIHHRDPPSLLPLVPPSFPPVRQPPRRRSRPLSPAPLLLPFSRRTPSSPPLFPLHLVTVPAVSFSSSPPATTSTIVVASLPSSSLWLHHLLPLLQTPESSHRPLPSSPFSPPSTIELLTLFPLCRRDPDAITLLSGFHRRQPPITFLVLSFPARGRLTVAAPCHRLDADLPPFFPTVASSPPLPTTPPSATTVVAVLPCRSW